MKVAERSEERVKRVYCDNGATTMVDPLVVKTMTQYFGKVYGNPSSLHSMGTEARKAVEEARKIVANSLKAKTSEIIFTSGGTESDNLAIKGIAMNKGKGHIITTKIEHPAVLRTCESLQKKGFTVTYLSVDAEGLISLEELEQAFRPDTILVSIMHANNEVGTIQPLEEIYELCQKNKALLHTDAVQSFTKTPVDSSMADLISLSSHKIHGPKGVGALYIKQGIKISKQNDGGGHEFKLRAGTENVPGIIGFAKAIEVSSHGEMKKLRDHIIKELLKIPQSRLNGHKSKRLINNINITFDRAEGESLLLYLDANGISVSTGSACSSKSLKPSHVLSAMGLRPEQSHGTIRITISRFTTKEEADYLIKTVKEVVEKVREMNPL